jgi:hypothetical protein
MNEDYQDNSWPCLFVMLYIEENRPVKDEKTIVLRPLAQTLSRYPISNLPNFASYLYLMMFKMEENLV